MQNSQKQDRAFDLSLVCGSGRVANPRTPTLRHLGRVTIVFVALAFTFLTVGRLALAQGIITGGISGTVTDPTGAIIPGAAVKVVGESTGTTFQVTSNGEGAFLIADVPLGLYTVSITANGFGPASTSHVRVVAGNTTPLGKQTLTLGSAAATTIEVEGSASELINTESAQVETTIDAVQLASAPVTGALDNMALMVPGVVNVHMDGNSNTNGINFSVNGQRGRSNNSEIDGQTNNDTSIGGPSFFFDNQDAVQEVQVLTTDMGAQYGRNMGGIVNYITKSGSNTFHGTGFEIYTGSWLSSLMQYQKDPNFGGCAGTPGCNIDAPKFVQNNWGGTLGGPILKNKLFFFGSTLWSHTYEGGVVLTSQGGLFPDPTGLQTLQSSFASNPAVASITANGPYASKAYPASPVPGTTSTVSVTDGTTVANVEIAQFERSFPTAIFDQEHLGRIDYQMSDKDRFYLRYNYQNNPYNPGFYLVSAATAAANGYPNVYGISHEVGSDWTHTFTPTLVNQLRYAFQQSSIGFYGGAIPSCTISDQSTCTSTVGMGGSFANYGYGANLPQGRFVKVNQVQDNATWSKGRHTILFGGEFDYQDSPWGFLPNDEGTFNFSPLAASNAANPSGIPFNYPASGCGTAGASCDNGLTGFLEGIGELNLSEGNPTIPFKEKDADFYFQDNFKLSKSLTLNLGLRYEFFGQAINFLHNETVARQTGSGAFWNTSLPLSATTIPSIPSFYKNIEPRIGFAYAPSSLPKLVVRGGYSINADPEFYVIFVNMATAAPAINAGAVSCDGVTVICVPSGGLTDSTVQAADDKYIPTGGDPRVLPTQTVPSNFHNPQGETYSLGIQYQVAPTAVADVRYVGNHTYGQFQALNSNPDIANVQTLFPSYGSGQSACTTAGAPGIGRPDCSYDQVEAYSNTAFSLYNALQTSLTVRNFRGFTGTASYTWSRDITNTTDFAVGGAGGQASPFAQNPLNSNLGERGVDGNSYPNIWGIQLTYNEPWFRDQRGILGRLLGGYMFNAFYQYNGGQAYNPIQNSYSVTSPNVLADIAGAANNPGGISTGTAATIIAAQAETGFCDIGFAQAFGGNPCRPVLSNAAAPLGSVGINLGPGGFVDYVSGASVSPASEHWLWNNQYEAVAKNNPFPGVGRNILRGDSFNDLDISAAKTVHLTERVSMQMMVSAFNVMNRAYYGTPDINVEHSLFGGFESTQFAFGTAQGSGAGGGSYPQGLGNRNVQLTGKIIF
jgi:hypothetical protein